MRTIAPPRRRRAWVRYGRLAWKYELHRDDKVDVDVTDLNWAEVVRSRHPDLVDLDDVHLALLKSTTPLSVDGLHSGYVDLVAQYDAAGDDDEQDPDEELVAEARNLNEELPYDADDPELIAAKSRLDELADRFDRERTDEDRDALTELINQVRTDYQQ